MSQWWRTKSASFILLNTPGGFYAFKTFILELEVIYLRFISDHIKLSAVHVVSYCNVMLNFYC